MRLKNKLKHKNDEKNINELSNQNNGIHSSEALNSSGINANVLSNEETIYKSSRVNYKTML